MSVKIRILSICFIFIFAVLIVKLFYWQVIKGAELSAQARSQYESSEITTAPRGNILAKDGSYWVIRVQKWNLWANPKKINENINSLAQKLSTLLVLDQTDNELLLQKEIKLKNNLAKTNLSWISLETGIDDETKRNIEALKITGLGFDPVESSYYPEASSAAQILGFVGKNEEGNNIGYFGLEGYYNLPLSGKPGFIGSQKNALGAVVLSNDTTQVTAVSGVNLVTNIDKRIQNLIEDQLKIGITKYGAIGGSITIMDPYTGQIMGIASFPSFNPEKYSIYNDTVFKNPVISDTFEPGSILKVLVMAAGIDMGVVTPETQCDICDKPLKVDKYYIKTWNDKYKANITMTDVIVDSDNVGMSFIGQKLGADNLYDYLNKFGIGEKTGIDLQGEVSSKLREKGTWNVVDLATASFGQGVAVTGIEMVRGVAAIANGGYLVTPKVVDSVKGEGWQEKNNFEEPIRIISQKAALETTQMMVQAVERGEAKWCRIPGFSVAGKTGTAQIPVEGHYDATNTNHSFIGFAPSINPRFIMLVTLKSPQSSPWAAETAAPLWFSIAKDLFPYLGISPQN